MTGDARRGTARDVQRARVYAAENFVRTMFDRAAERGNPVVDFFGASLTLPPEARFSSSETHVGVCSMAKRKSIFELAFCMISTNYTRVSPKVGKLGT